MTVCYGKSEYYGSKSQSPPQIALHMVQLCAPRHRYSFWSGCPPCFWVQIVLQGASPVIARPPWSLPLVYISGHAFITPQCFTGTTGRALWSHGWRSTCVAVPEATGHSKHPHSRSQVMMPIACTQSSMSDLYSFPSYFPHKSARKLFSLLRREKSPCARLYMRYLQHVSRFGPSPAPYSALYLTPSGRAALRS